jgi:hypothetical protein
MCRDLIRQGLNPQKSRHLAPPSGNVPVELLPHYWRGHFDGDGSISPCSNSDPGGSWQVSLLGTRGVVDGFISFVRERTGVRLHAGRHVNVWKAGTAGVQYPQAVVRLLYTDATVHLQRKKERADEFLAIRPRRVQFLASNGKLERIKVIAARLGITPAALSRRIKCGWGLTEAVSTPKRGRSGFRSTRTG